jgi:mannitol-1-phosphate 5-dehydrogenase
MECGSGAGIFGEPTFMKIANEKRIVIWGAGRIGRGFIGDVFTEAGYRLVYVDQAAALIDQLLDQGEYTVVRAVSESDVKRVKVDQYDAYQVSQSAQISDAINQAELMAIAVYPKNFESVAATLAELIWERRTVNTAPFNIILCTNLIHAGPIFKEQLYKNLTQEQRAYFLEFVGIIESLVIRICPNPPQEEVEKDPLVVWTNGYSVLPVEQSAFKGEPPQIAFFRYVQDMRAEEIRKIYSYNMCHAALSYHGYQRGYKLLVDCLADDALETEALGALSEVSSALQKEYGFTEDEMNTWIEGVLTQTNNRTVGDTVIRSAADPLRKLKKSDRLIGPALLCLRNGIKPFHLIRAIGAAFHYLNEEDQNSVKLAVTVRDKGIKNAIQEFCGLGDEALEKELAGEIEQAYKQIGLEIEWHRKALQAYDLGFKYEKVYHGCGQCSFAAITEVLGNFSPDVFNAATGLCGGIGLKNDAACSAFTGGAMAIGLLYPRRRENFDGDRENKYTAFDLVQQLREKFIQEFGSITCGCVHEKKYGRAYDLSQKEERDVFEEAGGHGDFGCTDVVGKASQFTVEVLAPLLMKNIEE